MGACLPRTIRNMRERNNSILEYLADFAEDESGEIDESKLEMLLKRGREVLGSLAECLKKWHRHLLESYIPIHKKKGGKGFVLPNAVGMTLPLWELHLDRPRYRWVGVARVAAHLLQGLEQACIQEQIVRDEGCKVISIGHDGFIINEGRPDMTLWNEITTKHGLGGMKLESKAL